MHINETVSVLKFPSGVLSDFRIFYSQLSLFHFIIRPFFLIFIQLMTLISVVINSIVLVFCYFCLKNIKRYPSLILKSYIIRFWTFAEFASAAICLGYGVADFNLVYFFGGLFTIIIGLIHRILLYFHQKQIHRLDLSTTTMLFTGVYILSIYLCSCTFYSIAMLSGIIPCASRVITCVFPVLTLAETIKHKVSDSFLFMMAVDLIAVAILWWYCAQVSVKHFIIVPNIAGHLLLFIDYFSQELTALMSEYCHLHNKPCSTCK